MIPRAGSPASLDVAGPGSECEVRFVNLGNRRCGAPAIGIITHGCVHEHLDHTPICPSCLLNARVLFNLHDIWCTDCDDSGHKCEVFELKLERFALAN